jgi:multidrug efflux pump subunit AcrA (membrane-fusion protein)
MTDNILGRLRARITWTDNPHDRVLIREAADYIDRLAAAQDDARQVRIERDAARAELATAEDLNKKQNEAIGDLRRQLEHEQTTLKYARSQARIALRSYLVSGGPGCPADPLFEPVRAILQSIVDGRDTTAAPDDIRGPIYEQVKAQVLADVYKIFSAYGFRGAKL